MRESSYPSPLPNTRPKTFAKPRKQTSGDSFMFRMLQYHRCAFRSPRNITSSIVDQPVAGLTSSLVNLTKGGLESVTGALAIEFARDGVRFNSISPGVVNTPMHQVETHEFLKQLSPHNRLAEIAEVVDLVLFLESASFLNGEVIHLDGG